MWSLLRKGLSQKLRGRVARGHTAHKNYKTKTLPSLLGLDGLEPVPTRVEVATGILW
jgi:hypothetical protein